MADVKLIARQDLGFLAIVGLIQILRSLRLPRLNAVAARGAGLAAYHLSTAKRRRIEENISKRLSGDRSLAERQQIVRRVFYETWRELLSWADANSEMVGAVDMLGLEHLHNALQAGHGAILWESNGFGRRKLMKRVLHAQGIELHQVHGPHDLGGFLLREPPSLVARTAIREFFDRCEKRFLVDSVWISDSNSLAFAKTLIGKLRAAAVLCISGDGQVTRHRIACDFLMGRSSFATGTVSLARLSGAPLLPVFCVETAGGRTAVIVEPAIAVSRGIARDASFEQTLVQYARLLDDYVTRYPEQYRNWHLLHEADSRLV